MEAPKLNILIVDDHDIVLKGIAMIVTEALKNFSLNIDTTTSGCKAIELLSGIYYDICILDIDLPDIDGIGMLNIIRNKHPETKIIVNTIHEELWYVKDYIHAKVEGILFKSVNASEISQAIIRVAEGKSYYCYRARTIMQVINGYNPPTPKELEVLQYIAEGKSTEQISRLMGTSTNTIETHRKHLLTKLSARNVAELIMNAVHEGLLNVGR